MIIRVRKHARDFTIIDNAALQDPALSFKATGLLAYLLSLPDDWRINRDDLAERKADGVTSVRSAMNELDAAGYLIRRRERLGNGTFQTTLEVHEVPQRTGGENATTGGGKPDPRLTRPPVDPPALQEPSTEDTDQETIATLDLGGDLSSVRATDNARAMDPLLKAARKTVADAVWAARAVKPAGGWIAVAKIAEKFLAAGTEQGRLTQAMIDAPTVTQNSIEVQLSRSAPRGRPRDSDGVGPRAAVRPMTEAERESW